MLLRYAICKMRTVAAFIGSGSRLGLGQPRLAAASNPLAYPLSLSVLVLTLAILFASSETHIWRSNHSSYQSMTTQEARDDMKRRFIEYCAKTFIESAEKGNTSLINIFLNSDMDSDVKGYSGRTVLMTAAGETKHCAVNLLLPLRVSINLTNDQNAVELMRQVVVAYHSLSTYSDRGSSITRVNGSDEAYEIRIEFETLFKRPGKLRFAWTHEFSFAPGKKQNVIWCDGATAWSSYSFRHDSPRRVKDLGLAVAGAIPASETTAHTIPRLLSDEVPGIRLDELQGLKITGNDTADGVECLVLVGYYASGGELKIWVGRKDHLIRRIEERSKDRTREEVRTQIVVDRDIADSRFSKQGR